MVEQLPVKELVPGSSPGRGAKLDTRKGVLMLLRETLMRNNEKIV